eukprot:556118_1
MDLNKVTTDTIDDILDEIEQNEQKIHNNNDNNNGVTDDDEVNWNHILNAIRNVNIGYIKNIITSNDMSINSQNPNNGKTLLIYSVIVGSYDLVQVLSNFGADPNVKDNEQLSALDYAIKYGRYKITELLFYQQLSGSLGNDLKYIASKIHEKDKEAKLINDFKFTHQYGTREEWVSNGIVTYMIDAIKKRSPFSADMLYYSWWFVINGNTERYGNKFVKTKNPLESPLWKTMMATFEAILFDTSDKNGWKWIKTYFINSLIWYLPHPNPNKINQQMSVRKRLIEFYQLYDAQKLNSKELIDVMLQQYKNRENELFTELQTKYNVTPVDEDKDDDNDDDKDEDDDDDDGNDMNKALKKTLFWELLWRVRWESKHQSNLLLKQKIDKIQMQQTDEWQILTSYNVNTKYSSNPRQDTCGCLIPRYKEDELSV